MPGWHVYWESSGQTGFPTSIKWELPKGISVSSLQFPTPEYYEFQGLVSYVHKDSLILLAKLKLDQDMNSSGSLKVKGNFSTLICNESTCIPFRSEFLISVEIGSSTKLNPEISRTIQMAKKPNGRSFTYNQHIINGSWYRVCRLIVLQRKFSGLKKPVSFTFSYRRIYRAWYSTNFSADSNGTTVGLRLKRASGIPPLIELKECFITLHLKDRTELILNRNESSTEKKLKKEMAQQREMNISYSDEDFRILYVWLSFLVLALAIWIYGRTNQLHHSKK